LSEPEDPGEAAPATENTSQKRQQAGKGRPFEPGEVPPGAKPWRSGQASPNPGGRPKTAPEHRARCRAWAEQALEQLGERIEGGRLSNDELIRAYETLADRGGYLSGDKLAATEAARWRVVLHALALQQLTESQRQGILGDLMRREREVLGDLGAADKEDDGGEENAAADAPEGRTKSLPVDPR
jgi:hypothetical protein